MIHCTNPTCRAWVTQPLGRCPTCNTPLLYRLLLAVSEGAPWDHGTTPPSGRPIAERYLVWKHPVWIDTRLEEPIAPVDPIPPAVLPYLHLSSLIQHIPRPYDYLSSTVSGLGVDVLLLDAAPLAITLPPSASEAIQVKVLPPISQAWAGGTALQQLDWLRQMALLWPALTEENVASTLLSPETLRVDQSLLRVTRLVADPPQAPTLANLGHRWQSWVAQAQPAIQDYLGWLTTALSRGQFASATALLAELDQAIQTLAMGLTVTVEWDADTDQGPARDRNEDACFPHRQAQKQVLVGQGQAQEALPLLLVCDGIGGHDHGNVASQIAIQTLTEALQALVQQQALSPGTVAQWLKQAMAQVNTNIADRNNDEHRSARARMGTTAVLALVHFPYVSVAHLGDSRAYRVSARTAYQITLDDDVASREVRMGYALYPEATHMTGGGALVQALGINDSAYLYPTVQHFLIDDPCLLLLCSDGLSDYDRVDMLWPHTVAPLVGQVAPLTPAIQTLIQWANQLNGHDNVTVGLMRFTPQAFQAKPLPAAAQRLSAAAAVTPTASTVDPCEAPQTTIVAPAPADSGSPTPIPLNAPDPPVHARPKARSFPWKALLTGALPTLALMAGAGWAYRRWQPPPLALDPLPPWPQEIGAQALLPLASTTVDIAVGSFWQRSVAWANPSQPDPLGLAPSLGAVPPGNLPTLPVGSILKVVDRRDLPDQIQWVYLQVCSIPAGSSPALAPQGSDGLPGTVPLTSGNPVGPVAQPGRQGWVRAMALGTNATPLDEITPSQRGTCSSP